MTVNAFAIDPQALMDVYCVHTSNTAVAAGTTVGLTTCIDVGLYEYVLILVAAAGGTATAGISVFPRESDAASAVAAARFPLDGTNGSPNLSMSFLGGATTGTNASHQRFMRMQGRRQFLDVVVNAVAANGTFRPMIYVVGIGKKNQTGRIVTADLAQVGPLGAVA